MTIFNIITGVVTLASLAFALWVYVKTDQKEAVEMERRSGRLAKLEDLNLVITAVEGQAQLILTMAEREETTSKELKHLAVAMLFTIHSIRRNIEGELDMQQEWEFGVPSAYLLREGRARNNGASDIHMRDDGADA